MTTSTEAVEALNAHSINFLLEEDYLFTSTAGTWVATNASLAVERTRIFRDSYQTLRIQPLSVSAPYTEVQITHQAPIIGSDYANDKMVGSAFIYPYAPLQVAIRINSSIPTQTDIVYVNCPALTWTLVRSAELEVPSNITNQNYYMTILFKSSGGLQHFHVGHPVLTNSYGFTQNRFLRETMMFMPQVLTEIDSQQTEPTFPMYRFMDVGLVYADSGYRQSIDFRYRDISEGYDETDDTTKSTLVDPDVAESEYLPWLAQFVGIQLPRIVGGSTPWGNLPPTWEQIMEDIDPVADVTYNISSVTRDGAGTVTALLTTSPAGLQVGYVVSVRDTVGLDGQFELIDVDLGTNTVQWSQEGSSTTETVGNITLVDTSWLEIEAYNTADSNFLPKRRALVNEARTGHRAGTLGALENAAKVNLTGTKAVNIIVEPIESPWIIYVQTLTSETPSGVTGQPATPIVIELNKVRPMGFTVIHECVASL